MAKDSKTRSEEIAEKYRRRAAERRGASVPDRKSASRSDGEHLSGRDTIDSLLRSAGSIAHRRPAEPEAAVPHPSAEMRGTAKPREAAADIDAETAEETEIAEELAENVREVISEDGSAETAGVTEPEMPEEAAADTDAEEEETAEDAETADADEPEKASARKTGAGPIPVPLPKKPHIPPAREPDPDVVMRSVSAVRRHDEIVRNRNRKHRKRSRGGISTWKILAACAALLAVVVLFVVIVPAIRTGAGRNSGQNAQNESQGMSAEAGSMEAEESVTGTGEETAGTADETAESETGTASESESQTAEAAGAVAPEDKPPAIALTFDDGPSDKTTNELLDVLEQYNAHATFFIVGQRVEGNEAILQREWDLGCELGNHTWSHAHLRKSSKETRDTEIAKCTEAVEAAVPGAKVTVIRPPYGADNPEIKEELQLPIILWSLDTLDWKTRDADKTVDNILSNVRGGDIILMHDIHAETIEAAKRVIPQLVEQGYKLVTVSELYEYYDEPLKLHVNHTYSGPKRTDED